MESQFSVLGSQFPVLSSQSSSGFAAGGGNTGETPVPHELRKTAAMIARNLNWKIS